MHSLPRVGSLAGEPLSLNRLVLVWCARSFFSTGVRIIFKSLDILNGLFVPAFNTSSCETLGCSGNLTTPESGRDRDSEVVLTEVVLRLGSRRVPFSFTLSESRSTILSFSWKIFCSAFSMASRLSSRALSKSAIVFFWCKNTIIYSFFFKTRSACETLLPLVLFRFRNWQVYWIFTVHEIKSSMSNVKVKVTRSEIMVPTEIFYYKEYLGKVFWDFW